MRPAPNRIAPVTRTASANGAGRGVSAAVVTLSVLVGRERKERENARPLHGLGDLGLMPRAGARNAPRNDLAPIGDETGKAAVVLVVDPLDLIEAELAELAPKRTRFAVARHRFLLRKSRCVAGRSGGATPSRRPGSPVRRRPVRPPW